jgi:hypothetical protein
VTIKVTAFRLQKPLSLEQFLVQKDSLECFEVDKLVFVGFQEEYIGKMLLLSRINLSVFPFNGSCFKPDELGLLDNSFGIEVIVNNKNLICIGRFTEYTISEKIDLITNELFKMNSISYQASIGFEEELVDEVNKFLAGNK